MIVYISGKYSGTDDEVQANINHAREVSVALWEIGHAVICPHLNTANFEKYSDALDYDDYIKGDLALLARCDAIVMLTGWESSNGATLEKEYAEKLNIPVYFQPNYPGLHVTEIRCPEQVKRFAEITGMMYRTHLDKNADYSPANILAVGEIGLITRLWDKIARLLNLYGFRFKIDGPGVLEKIREPKNESIDDSFMDAAVYSIIGLLLRQNVWGK